MRRPELVGSIIGFGFALAILVTREPLSKLAVIHDVVGTLHAVPELIATIDLWKYRDVVFVLYFVVVGLLVGKVSSLFKKRWLAVFVSLVVIAGFHVVTSLLINRLVGSAISGILF